MRLRRSPALHRQRRRRVRRIEGSIFLAISDAIEAEWHRENYDAEAISRAWKKEAANVA
jgi:hypothetical protein